MINLLHGDCLEQMKTLEDNSVDSIVSDPPYGISFMAKKWDYDVPSVEVWKEAMRVLKPGGHALIACGTRTQHRMVVNIEDAGFEIRDVVSWIYGSGFPKSLNIGKAVDKLQGNERRVVGKSLSHGKAFNSKVPGVVGTNPNEKAADETKGNSPHEGWGTALKPSSEFFTLCRKPLSEKTVAANVLKWGTGGINIDGCRVGTSGATKKVNTDECRDSLGKYGDGLNGGTVSKLDKGRFPANLIHDGSEEVLELFPESKPNESAARFFYCAKASKKDRDEGNNHPTVKPTALMSYLCRLITPTGGVVLDPYMGSGSTGKAAVREGFSFVGCELDPDYYEIAKARVNHSQ